MKVNELRREMETRFPARVLTPEEKAELWQQAKLDGMLGYNIPGRK